MLQRRDPEAGGTLSADAAGSLAAAALALARHFASDATLWCWAPGAPEHAQHVAVEFVHPVIAGTRALPAVAVVDHDAIGSLRPMVRPGDVLLVVADGQAPVAGVLRRAEAWGLITLWLGSGPDRPDGLADHVLWLGENADAGHDGRLALGYHLLWELTHVCFEHPGLLDADPGVATVCVTCADEGLLGEVVDSDGPEARVRLATGIETVSTMMVGPVHPNDLVLVHAGTAITVVDP